MPYLSLPPYSLQTEASGIYCALCVLLRQMEVEGCVDVVTTLQRLREQRPGILTSQVMKARSREEGRVGRKEGRKKGRGREERRRKRGTGGRGKEVGGGKRLIFTFFYSTTIFLFLAEAICYNCHIRFLYTLSLQDYFKFIYEVLALASTR